MNNREQAALVNATLAAVGMTPAGLAVTLGVHKRTVQRWRAGEVPMPGPAIAYCKALLFAKAADAAP